MDDFLMAFSAVFPMFFYMVLGGFISKKGWMEKASFQKLNQVIFKIFIPLMLFVNIYESDFKKSANPRLIFLVLLLVIVVFLLLCLIVPIFVKEKADASVMIQGIYRSNYVLFGLTMASSIYRGEDLGVVSALAAFLVPLFNALAVILFEMFRGGKIHPLELFTKILKNPLIIGGLLGIFFALTEIRLPVLLVDTLSDAGSIASPVALICLGGMLSFQSLKKHWGKLLAVLSCRLVLLPLTAITLFALLGYRNMELITILAAFGSPTAVASGPMAQSMGGNGELAGEIIAAGSAGCIVTIFLFVWVMKSIGLIA
ncbi:MAG: AEC family transporter [Fusicatenibacter sp.]|nr:AEC family transporter [Lachnospiraceae bacterium]MDY2938632.1 AEC family transporter [Fusicatenibacter sp.]